MRIQKVTEKKEGRAWTVTNTMTDPAAVNESLMHALIAKKLHNCTYIRRITDRPNYDGTRDVVVTYDNDVRDVYTVKF